MDPRRNPFAPGAGSRPPELAGREAVLESVAIALDRVDGDARGHAGRRGNVDIGRQREGGRRDLRLDLRAEEFVHIGEGQVLMGTALHHRNAGRHREDAFLRRGEGGPQISEIDQLMKRGQEQLRVLMGGRGTGGTGGGAGGSGGPMVTRQGIALGVLALIAAWSFMSFYSVRTEERSVELFLGESAGVGEPGLNFAPWPIVTYEKVLVTGERTTDIPQGQDASGASRMLTGDQNVVDIGFQVVWNISDPEKYLFNLADPENTIRAVSESAMRDIIAQSQLSPILNRDRGVIARDLRTAVQTTLDSYSAGINVIRVNLKVAQAPAEVIDAFNAVQSAQQERDRLEKEADAYANKVTAGARGEAAQLLEEAEAYRAQAVNSAKGEAARFISVYEEYVKAPEVTRRRLYLETMERIYRGADTRCDPGEEELGDGRRESCDDVGNDEEGEATDEDVLAAPPVADRADRHEERRQGDRVAVDDPEELALGCAELGRQLLLGDVEARHRGDDGHERRTHGDQDEPTLLRVRDVVHIRLHGRGPFRSGEGVWNL